MGGKVLLAVAASLLLTACGGGGDNAQTPASPPAPLTGVLIDSPVQGLPYSTSPSGLSGKTGANGEFQYRPGDMVTFVFGGGSAIAIGLGQPIITPFSLLGSTTVPSVNHVGPVNLARLLLALDTTPGTEVLTMPATFPIIPPSICFTCDIFSDQMVAAGIPLASEGEAKAHLKKQFAIWGSWTTVSTPTDVRVFTFLPDGGFVLANDDNPSLAGGNDGMERGRYQWNPNTNEFKYTVEVNSDGTGGLSSLTSSQTPPYSFVIDAGGNTAVLRLGPTPGDEIHLTRVMDLNNVLVGAWRLSSPFPPSYYMVVTFQADGSFLVASDPIDTAPAGMERGTYEYNSVTGKLSFTTTVDTNGEFGFNDGIIAPGITVVDTSIASSFGDHDFLNMDDGTGNGVIHFERVRVP